MRSRNRRIAVSKPAAVTFITLVEVHAKHVMEHIALGTQPVRMVVQIAEELVALTRHRRLATIDEDHPTGLVDVDAFRPVARLVPRSECS